MYPNPRHSGVRRRREPGIQNDGHGVWLWIPGLLASLASRNDK